jgi:hypothetical protein
MNMGVIRETGALSAASPTWDKLTLLQHISQVWSRFKRSCAGLISDFPVRFVY